MILEAVRTTRVLVICAVVLWNFEAKGILGFETGSRHGTRKCKTPLAVDPSWISKIVINWKLINFY